MLSYYDIKNIINGDKDKTSPSNNFKVIDSYPIYDEKATDVNERKLQYLCYELESMNPDTGEVIHFYKAIKFARVIRLPKAAKESRSFMDMHSQILSGVYEQGINLITIIANIIEPVALGLLYLYGVQGVADNIDDAKKIAHNDFIAFTTMMQGTFRVLEMRTVKAEEGEWLREKIYNMEYITAARGIPKANKAGEDMGNKGIGGKNLNPDSQGTIEEFIAGMADYEYVVEILSTPVPMSTLRDWSYKTEKHMTDWYSQLQGTKALSFSVSIPMMYMANNSTSTGWSKAYSDGTSVSHSAGESFSQSYGQSVGQSVSQSYGHSQGRTFGESLSHSQSVSRGHTVGSSLSQSLSQGVSSNVGLSHNQNTGVSQGQNIGMSSNIGASQNNTHGISRGQSFNESFGQNVSSSHNVGSSYNTSFGESYNTSRGSSASQSVSDGYSSSISAGHSSGVNHSSSYGTNSGWNSSVGKNFSGSETNGHNTGSNIGGNAFFINGGSSWGDSHSVTNSNGTSSSNGTSGGFSESSSTGYSSSDSISASSGVSHSQSSSIGQSFSVGHGVSSSQGWGVNESFGNSVGKSYSEGYGVNYGASDSQSFGQTQSNGVSAGQSLSGTFSNGMGISQSLGKTASVSQGVTQSVSDSVSQSEGYTMGQSQSVSSSDSVSQGISKSATQSQSISNGTSTSDSTGTTQSTSMGNSGAYVSGASSSMGFGPSIGYNKSYQWMDQQVKDILELLEYQNERLKKTLRGTGAFYSYCYIACSSMDALSAAMAVAKSTWQNEFALRMPIQVLDLEREEQRHLLYHFAAFSADITRVNVSGVSEYKYATVLLPSELVAYTHPPRASEGGIFSDANDVPKFAVPSMMKGEIYMGTVLSAERYTMQHGYRTQFDYRISEKELMHGYFTGASRSGKTVAAMRFVAELSQIRRSATEKRLRIVCMDPKRDWRTLARFVEPERFRFYSLGNEKFRPIKINPFIVPRGVVPQTWIDGVIDIYCRAYGLLERGKQMMGETIYALYQEAGVFDACIDWPDGWDEEVHNLSKEVTFEKVYQKMLSIKVELEDPNNKKGRAGNDTRDAYARLLDRLQAFSRPYSIETKLFGTNQGIGIDDMIGDDDVTVLESSGLEKTFKNFIFGIITSGFYKYAKAHEGGFLAPNQYETVLVIEEANEVLIGNDAAGSGGGSAMGLTVSGPSEFEEILDQSAGYGLFIIAITQKIADMPKSVIANSGLIFAGRLKTEKDIQVVIRSIGREERYDDRDVLKWFPRMETGMFVCQRSRTFDFKDAEPILVAIARLNINPPTNLEIDQILTNAELRKNNNVA